MKLLIAIVSEEDTSPVIRSLNDEGFHVTKLSTTGGFLRAGNSTLLTGIEDDQVETAMEIIKGECRSRTEIVPSSGAFDTGRFGSLPIEVTVGGATVFVLDVEQFRKL